MATNENKRIFPYDIVDFELVDQKNKNQLNKYTLVGPKKYLLFPNFRNNSQKLYNFESRSTDIWITTFPRSGTTWASELVWLIINNLDYKTAKEKRLFERVSFFEGYMTYFQDVDLSKVEIKNPIIDFLRRPASEILNKTIGPRIIKSHFPLSLLPASIIENQSKVIYIARNPKDVIVSFYHFTQMFQREADRLDFHEFYCQFERNENILYGPFWSHIHEGWINRNEKNVLFLFYEEMKTNLPKCIRKVAEFLGKPLTENEVMELCNHLNFDNFKNNESVNPTKLWKDLNILNGDASFIRKGESNTNVWPSEYTPDLIERFKLWMEKNSRETGITFPDH